MATITTRDGVEIYYKDWGPKDAQPIVFHHGWPLSSDDWDTQMLFFVSRATASSRTTGAATAARRRSATATTWTTTPPTPPRWSSTSTCATPSISAIPPAAARRALRRAPRPAAGRVAKVVLIGAVPPLMVKTAANPGGLPIEVFDGFRKQLAANRAQFYLDVASGPFYGFNRPGATAVAGRDPELVAAGHDGQRQGALRRHQGLLRDRLHRGPEAIDVPTLVMHGEDDQIVPIAASALLSVKLLRNGTLKVYRSFPHGMCTTHADVVNADLLAFARE